jgi:hypothetical protein
MLKYVALSGLALVIVLPAFAQQPAAQPAPAPAAQPPAGQSAFGGQPAPQGGEGAQPGRGGGRGGRGGPPPEGFQGGRGPGGEGFAGRGGGRGAGGEGRGPGRGGQQQTTTVTAPVVTTTITPAPSEPITPPPPPAPLGPTLPGTVVKSPPGLFAGMGVINSTGDLYGRVVVPPEGDTVIVQTIDGKRHRVPVAELTIKDSLAVTTLTERALKNLPGPGSS